MNSAFTSTISPSSPCDVISAATMVAVGCINVSSKSLSLFAKCKRQNSHRSSLERGAQFIGPHSMHRHRPSRTQSPLEVTDQPGVHALNVVVGRILERLVRKVRRVFKEGITYFFAHGGIVRGVRGKFHSWFPVVGFVHSCNVAAH